jgi:glycerophosphoryl diester phosphodiesterase family protein
VLVAELSISKAWEETRAVLAHDGRLIASVALALIALPTAVSGLINPTGMGNAGPMWTDAIVLIASLAALAGQLALIRLALGPSIAVGEAIAHGLRRMPIYLLSAIVIVIALMVIATPFAVVLAVFGVPLDAETLPATPSVIVMLVLFVALVFYIGVRMLMSAPVASAQDAGPIAIIQRSWGLTSGHWWGLFGFLILFFIGAIVALLAVSAAAGALAALFLGPIEPMSASALLVALVEALTNAAITGLFAVMLARIYVQLAGRDQAQAGVPNSGI